MEKAGPKPDSPRKMEEAMKGRVGGKKDPAELKGDKEKVVAGPKPEPVKVYDPLLELADILKRSPSMPPPPQTLVFSPVKLTMHQS